MRLRALLVGCGVVVALALGSGVPRFLFPPGPLALVEPARLHLPEATPAGPASAAVVSRRVGHAFGGWRVVREISIHRVVVMTIEAADPTRAMDIAPLAIEPYQPDHYEALVYFVESGPAGHPTFRIRWTPRGGFVHEAF